VGSSRFGGLLDRGERHRNAVTRCLGAFGDLGLRVVAVSLLEAGNPCNKLK